jgi:coenzyme F420 hydrogenase subunit beta
LEWQQNETIAFDRETCIACGVCYAVCPPENPQGFRLAADSDPLLGPSTSLYRGFAADTAVREAGSAGGFVTALLVSALEQGVIDGALVVTSQPKDPTRPQITVARTPEGIRAAAQSKYCLAPVNATLDQIRQHDGKLAVVALPCQAHGIRLAQSLNLEITRNIVLVVGIFCGFNIAYEGTAYLLRKLGMPPEEVELLEHRGGPWPGGFRAKTRDGREGFIPKHQYTYVHLMYAPEGCWYCPDLTAEYADVSVGDFWVGDESGFSMVIGRTTAGQAVLDIAISRGDVIAESIGDNQALASHHHLLMYKKKGVQVRRSLSRRKPVEGYNLPPLTFTDRLTSTMFYALMRVSSSPLGQRAIGTLPLGLTGWLSESGRNFFRNTNQ